MTRYDAFISYSHAKDKPIASALQSVMQRLGKPWYRRRALRIFRDDTSLAAAPELWPAIEQALAQSRFLILLASPEAASSKWVDDEIVFWLRHRNAGTVLLALTDGQLKWDSTLEDFGRPLEVPLPPALEGAFRSEPKWVDLTGYRSHAFSHDRRLMELGADLAAAIHGIPKEDLLSEEVRQQRRALKLAMSAVITLVVLVLMATTLGVVAHLQRTRAENALAASTDTANELVMDVAVKIRNRLGIPVHLVREVLTRARDLLNRLSASGEIGANLRSGIGRALRELAQTMLIQGDTATALETAERSREITLGLVTEEPSNEQWQNELSLSHNRVGEALSRSGRRAEALKAFQLAFDIRKSLAERAPADADWQRDLAVSYERIGDELMAVGETDDAHQYYRSAFDIRAALALDDPTNKKWSRDLSVSHEKIGDVHFNLQEFESALRSYGKSLEIRQSLAAADHADAELQRDIAVSHAKIGDVEMQRRRRGPGIAAYRASLTIRQKLAAGDPGNVQWQIDFVVILLKLAEADDDPAARYALAIEAGRRLEAEGKLPAGLRDWLQGLEARLKH